MTRTANLSCTVYIGFTDRYNRELDATVEVEYTFDGDLQSEPLILSANDVYGNADGISDDEFNELVWEAVNDRCMDDYSEWYADNADQDLAA
jgi:hypothetical protein